MDERNTPSANHVYDQRLREQSFYEPALLEQVSALGCVCLKHIPHQSECRAVEDRANGTDEEHKPADVADPPASRLFGVLFVHVVERYEGLRAIVEQILSY